MKKRAFHQGGIEALTKAIQGKLTDARWEKKALPAPARSEGLSGLIERGVDAAETVRGHIELVRGRVEKELPRLHSSLEEFSAREPQEPEEAIRRNFGDISVATLPPRRFGYIVAFAFFVVGGFFAMLAPLSSAAIAPGVVSPKSSRQVVQHLEGGIIRQINVHEGDRVKAGQVLVTLEDVGARSDVNQLTNQVRHLAATQARLEAERDNQPTVEFSHALLRDLNDPQVRQIIDAQVNQFVTRRASDDSRRAILTQRKAQLQEQIGGLNDQLAGIDRQIALTDEETETVKGLLAKGYERKPRLLGLQKARADLSGQQGDLKAKIAQANEAIGENDLEIMKTDIERTESVDAELAETQAKKMEADQKLREARDRLARTQITAPVTGVVLDLRLKTAGGVIKPGQDVVDIIPTEDALVIDARVSPRDIDQVHAGLKARVVFSAYAQRTMPTIDGLVRSISADVLEDQRTGDRYYSARVEVDRKRLNKIAPIIELQPGMVAEVFIATGERTLMDYLLQPFFNVLRRSMREA